MGPLVGQSSDGDSRRRKLHLINAAGLNGDRYKLEHENFTHSGKTSENAVENLSDQDYIHNGKKLINHLKHPSSVLSLGGNPCHMDHLELLPVNMQINQFDHGLNRADIERADRMNWESAQRVMFPRVRECLQRINSGQVQPKQNVHGTIAYLLMCWSYIEIFYSIEATLLTRVKYASFVVNFLRIWRCWVYRTGDLNLQTNFISRETYLDLTLSCHQVVLFIMASRDFAPNYPICFPRLGTDVCEEFFSANGSFIVNKHNYIITDMYRNLGNMNRLQEIFADEDGPDNPRKHRKGENIWNKGNSRAPGIPAPDLKDFPDNDMMIKYWQRGLEEAQELSRSLDIRPANNNVDETANDWFFKLHKIDSTTENGMFQQMWTDHDNMNIAAGFQAKGEDLQVVPQEVELLNMGQTSELSSHLRAVVDYIEDDSTLSTFDATEQDHKPKLTVKVPSVGEVHKSTLVSLLNSNPSPHPSPPIIFEGRN